MTNGWVSLRGLGREQRSKAAILFTWFFLIITTLWLLKPIRQASLLAHLGATELPYARFGAVAAVAIVVAFYSRLVDRLTRVQVARGASLVFALVIVAFWIALRVGGEALGAQRWFVWAVFILVDVFSTVMIGIFWTYTNDVVTREEADTLYGPIGVGGILGGVVGGVTVDALVGWIGNVNMLLVCAGLMVGSAAIVGRGETYLHPKLRPPHERTARVTSALEGARLVFHSRYLLLIAGIVIAYEFAAATTDFIVSVVVSRHYTSQTEIAQVFGRIGWIVSGVALVSQLVLVPMVLSKKRIALLLAPIAMAIATVGLAILPVVAMAVVLSAADRGLNYSVQQATKETLYVPLGDSAKYKAKAFIDVVIDRFGKALSSVALIVMIALAGVSISVSVAIALGALIVWTLLAWALGLSYVRTIGPATGPTPPIAMPGVPLGERFPVATRPA